MRAVPRERARIQLQARTALRCGLAAWLWVWFWAWLWLASTAGCSSDGGDRRAAVTSKALEAASEPSTLAALTLLTGPNQPELWLSDLGLYSDIASKQLMPDVYELTPQFALWSDGAAKRRWLRLPAGERIDTSVVDDWQFPVGAMAFKEFSAQQRRIETRLIARIGKGARDYWMGAFVWNDDESDARFSAEGVPDARGTDHDVPSAKSCGTCHNGEPGRILGFSAVQTPELPAELLSQSLPPVPAPFRSDEPSVARSALGYLHANCAHCHNPGGSARPDTDMDLRLSVNDREPDPSAARRTTVGQPLLHSAAEPLPYSAAQPLLRVTPGAPELSGVLRRMASRARASQMPPIGTELVDSEGVALIRAWILSLEG